MEFYKKIMNMKNNTILDEAKTAVYGDRQDAYGPVSENFGRIAALWSVVIGAPVTAEQVALCMVQLKVARELHKPNRDNLVDGAGYFATLEKMSEELRTKSEELEVLAPEEETGIDYRPEWLKKREAEENSKIDEVAVSHDAIIVELFNDLIHAKSPNICLVHGEQRIGITRCIVKLSDKLKDAKVMTLLLLGDVNVVESKRMIFESACKDWGKMVVINDLCGKSEDFFKDWVKNGLYELSLPKFPRKINVLERVYPHIVLFVQSEFLTNEVRDFCAANKVLFYGLDRIGL